MGYDTGLRTRVIECLDKTPRGLTSREIAMQVKGAVVSVRAMVQRLYLLHLVEAHGHAPQVGRGLPPTRWCRTALPIPPGMLPKVIAVRTHKQPAPVKRDRHAPGSGVIAGSIFYKQLRWEL